MTWAWHLMATRRASLTLIVDGHEKSVVKPNIWWSQGEFLDLYTWWPPQAELSWSLNRMATIWAFLIVITWRMSLIFMLDDNKESNLDLDTEELSSYFYLMATRKVSLTLIPNAFELVTWWSAGKIMRLWSLMYLMATRRASLILMPLSRSISIMSLFSFSTAMISAERPSGSTQFMSKIWGRLPIALMMLLAVDTSPLRFKTAVPLHW